MSGREFKPGTVAMIRQADASNERRAMRVGNIGWHLRPCSDGEEQRGQDFLLDSDVAQVRHLVTVDPEDPEEIGRLLTSLQGMSFASHACGAFTCLQAALRSLVEPPKPPEPTGLGAVVEDAEGCEWLLRIRQATATTKRPWIYYDAETFTSTAASYADITAVRVLSEGIQ